MPDTPPTSFIRNLTVKEPAMVRHNWLYSVLPNKVNSQSSEEALYLTGYCRPCDNAFSVEIPKSDSGKILLTKMDIPKWGCIEPDLG